MRDFERLTSLHLCATIFLCSPLVSIPCDTGSTVGYRVRDLLWVAVRHGCPYKEGQTSMITQAIRRWLEKLFGWFFGKPVSENEYAPVGSPLNKSVTQESVGWPTSDGIAPQSGVAQRIVGQGETSCSTIDEWPERKVPPPAPPAMPVEKNELPAAPPQLPATPPLETTITALDTSSVSSDVSFPLAPPLMPERKLEFLHYLVKRGIVNEGFAEGQVPEQYRK